MNEMVSLHVGTAVEAPACIIDGSLALSPLGLILALRLARSRRVWLARAMWALLDNDEFYQKRPDLIGESGDGVVQARMLGEWRRAWLAANLLDQCFWIGDARHDSLLPAGMDDSVVDQFELLSQALVARDADLARAEIAPLAECARDAIVLSAVLGMQYPVILTAQDNVQKPPDLCRMLAKSGIGCRRVKKDGRLHHFAECVLPAAMWFTVRQFAATGIGLAAVHLIAPRAVATARQGSSQSWSGDEPLDFDPWADACAVWHTVG